LANRQASFAKRQKEIARKAHQQKKAEKKEMRRNSATPRGEMDEDPDIAGIIPGPQPPRED
jgi:sRNA-binding protein